jgi:histidinol-phosphatase (PHP family)
VSIVYHNLFDSHIHSGNSPDGRHTITYLAESAVEKGLMGIAVTDHVECLGFEEGRYKTRMIQSAVDTAKCKAAFRHRITLAIGVELGVSHGKYNLAQRILELYPYDFVLGACHHTRGGERLSDVGFAALTASERGKLLDEYFEDMAELVRWGGFDSLAHITYPMRFGGGDAKDYREQIDALLRLLVEKGKALALGTGELDNVGWLVRRYRELGGERVTIGSGAHAADKVGEGLDGALALLTDAGYTHFAFYKARNAIMLRIV